MGRVLKKWNHEKHDYEPFEVDEDWKLVLFTNDMNEITTCPHCGKNILYGESYTSKEIHTEMGMGYPVCGKCYEKEWRRERLARDKE